MIEGAIDLNLLHALETDPQARYVRRGTTYEANFPPGDPRDRDGR